MCRGKSFSYSAALLLFIFQIVILQLQQTYAANNYNRTCAPSSCGKVTNISYPFRLKNHDPETCGDQRYELTCENNITVLSLLSGKYFVQSINYKNYTIRLVDPGIHDSNCSSIPRYFLYNSNFSDSYSHSDNFNPYQTSQRRIIDHPNRDLIKLPMFRHVIYMNCSNPVWDDPVYADTSSCIKGNSQGHLYAIAGDLKVGNLKDECHVELVAATSFFGFDYSRYYDWEAPNKTYSYNEIHKMLVGGFDVSWMSGPCEDVCGDPGCYLSETTGNLECNDWSDNCVTPLGFHVRCGTPSRLRIFVEDKTQVILPM